jgi:hypothetical protein
MPRIRRHPTPRTTKRMPRWLWVVGLLAVAYHDAAAAVIGWVADHPTLTLTATAVFIALGPLVRKRVRRAFR